jgi:hypothetical protein
MVIAVVLALLLALSWLPRHHSEPAPASVPEPVAASPAKPPDNGEFARVLAEQARHKSAANTTPDDSAVVVAPTVSHGTALPYEDAKKVVSVHEDVLLHKESPHEVATEHFVRAMDVLLVLLIGGVWWSTHRIEKMLGEINLASARQTQEIAHNSALIDGLTKAVNDKAVSEKQRGGGKNRH